MSGMSVASSIDRPISDVPGNLGPSMGSQHAPSQSSGSEEVWAPTKCSSQDCHFVRLL